MYCSRAACSAAVGGNEISTEPHEGANLDCKVDVQLRENRLLGFVATILLYMVFESEQPNKLSKGITLIDFIYGETRSAIKLTKCGNWQVTKSGLFLRIDIPAFEGDCDINRNRTIDGIIIFFNDISIDKYHHNKKCQQKKTENNKRY